MADALDNVYSAPIPPDQQKTPLKAAAAAAQKTSDTFVIERSGLNVVANGVYAFSFAYTYSDPENPSNTLLSLPSANFRFTLEVPDYTVPVQNLTVTPGALSYIVKWDPIDKSLSANKWFIDAQIYESTTGAFAGEEYLVWNGTGNTATILVSDLNNRWIRVDTRDQDYHKKSVLYGPFKATDPIIVDTTGPGNVTGVTTSGGIDTSGYMGFNGYATISWPAVTGNGIRGYRIRFSNDNNATYSYVDSPGTGTSYKLGGLAVGATYKIAVATYDEYNNTSSSYVSGSDVTISGVPAITNYITAGPFQFGVGVGSVSTNKGLYFDASNYWLVNATNSARLKVGGSTSNYLEWNGTRLAIDGDITARGGTFSGNILMSTTGASIYSGTVTAAGVLTGNGFALNSTGLKVQNGSNSVTIAAATGSITANAGTIAGWTMSGTTLSKNNVILDSAGKIQVGAAANTSVYIQSVAGTSPTKTYVMWAGNNTPNSNAKFKVASDGTLYATGAVFGTGSSISGYATSTELTAVNTTATTASTTAQTAATNAATAKTAADAAKATADAALPKTSFDRAAIVSKISTGVDSTKIDGGLIQTGTVSAAAVVADFISAFSINADKITAGMIKGIDIDISTDTSSGRFKTSYSRSGPVDPDLINSTAINAVAFVSTNTSGWVTSCYPYYSGAADLGLQNYRWRRLLLDNGSYGTTSDSYIDLGYNTTRLYTDGRIYANTLGTGSGSTIVQSSGFLRVQTSSSRYKENILEINKFGYLDLLYKLKPVTYTYKEEFWPEGNRPVLAGLIAEDVDTIEEFRTVVNYNEEGLPDSIAYDRMSSLLILGIKEIKDKIYSIESRLDALET